METVLNLLPLTPAQEEAFRAAAPGIRHIFRPVEDGRFSARPPAEELAQATVILGCAEPASLVHAERLKWLQTWSAGVDPYLRPGVFPAGVMLTSAVGAYGPSVSEHLTAMLLSLMKRLPAYRDAQHRAHWEDLGGVRSILGASVLVAGCGDIGSAFAQRMKALGAGRVVGLRRDASKGAPGFDEIRPMSELDALLPGADVFCLVLPHTPETAGLVNADRLGRMKKGSLLLNAGRGTAVDCAALAAALDAGGLWGAGMDVTDPEPLPADHPLWRCPNALVTPHVAGVFNHMDYTFQYILELCRDNLGRYLRGEALRNRVR